ncbi:MAG: hypothetical protein ACOZIN_18820 [Myxococcota bacterium]
MTDVTTETPSPAPTAPTPVGPERMEQAQKLLAEIFRLLELPAKLELKPAADGGISVAVFFEGEVPGVPVGRRSHLIDAVQFLANKITHRPGVERRWISLGVGGHPEPRQPRPPPAARPAAAKLAPRPSSPARNGHAAPPAPPTAPASPQESTLEVSEEPQLSQAVRALAEKSAQFGRFFALSPMSVEDRARVLKAAAGVPGVSVRVEGEGRARRVVFAPDKPAPMPKKSGLPAYDDDDEA